MCQTVDLGAIVAKGWSGIEVRSGTDRSMRLSLETRLTGRCWVKECLECGT